MNYQGDYFIGLDLGTGSVGWAVTDTEYRLLKANQKSLWGIRLFDDAQTAAQTRGYRTARRRNERRKQRIQWLQQLFDAEIATVDPAFFIRLQESKFRVDDKREVEQTGRFALFNDPGFTDKEYHEKYPTIYHLRKALLTEQGPFDVRLVYLAVHHILKNRGHFLSEMDAADGVQPFRAVFENLREVLDREHEIAFDLKDPDEFEQILRDRTLKVTQKKSQLKKAAGVEKASDDEGDVALDVMVELLAGASVRLAALFRNKELKELGSIALDDKFEEQMESLTESLEEGSGLLLACKALSDWAELVAILGEDRYISLAKVRTYEKHRSDLEQLKGIVRRKLPDAYPAMFHAEGLDNYAAYCGNGEKSCSYEDFTKYTKKLLSQIKDDPEVKEILAELESGSFLPKQTVKSNSVIPR